MKEIFASAFAQATFTKITTGEIVNDGGASFRCAWGDYDNDGFLDLLVTNLDPDTQNFLYHNNRDGTFTRVTVGAIANDSGPLIRVIGAIFLLLGTGYARCRPRVPVQRPL